MSSIAPLKSNHVSFLILLLLGRLVNRLNSLVETLREVD